MKKIYTVLVLILCVTIVMSFDILSSNGKAGKTGSPGESDCTSCHAGTVNTGPGSVTITSPDLIGWAYTPGQTYTINVTITQASIPLFAFGFEALDASGANAGTLIITNSAETQIKNFTVSPNSRANVVHKTDAGLTTGSHTFTFNWTAPSANIGNVTFYVAGMACDNDGGTPGDDTYTSSQVVSFSSNINETYSDMIDVIVYPNPAKEKATIKYLLKKNAEVRIELVSIIGKVIPIYSNKEEYSGLHHYDYSFNSLSSGLYFMNIYIDDIKNTQKLFIE